MNTPASSGRCYLRCTVADLMQSKGRLARTVTIVVYEKSKSMIKIS